MKCLCKIIKCVGIYLLFVVLLNVVFSWIYFEMLTNYSYSQIFIYSISDNLAFLEAHGNNNIYVLQTIHYFCQIIGSSVMTGFVFTYIINKEPNLLWPSKLIIRRDDTEEQKSKLKLGILIGNKSKKIIYEANCTVSFSYIDEKGKRNASQKIEQDIMSIENYNRFSFDLATVPTKLLKDFLNKNVYSPKEHLINVYIRGNLSKFGKPFLLWHQYTLNDICIIDRHDNFEEDRTYGNITWKKISWDAVQMKKIIPCSPEIEKQIKKEIGDIILQQSKKRKRSYKRLGEFRIYRTRGKKNEHL